MDRYNIDVINRIIKEEIDKYFISEAKEDKMVTNMRNRINKHMQGLVDKRDPRTMELFRSIGYDEDYTFKKARQRNEELFSGLQLSPKISQDILRVAEILVNGGFVDKNGRVFLKRDELALKQKEADIQNGRQPRPYLEDYYQGAELDEIIRLKEFMDLKGLTYLYDKTAGKPSNSYGVNWKDPDLSQFDLNKYTEKEIEDYRGKKDTRNHAQIEADVKTSTLNAYLKAKYGMELEVPNVSFSTGNKKLPTSTLIINFDSAIGCPAWNECLVKHACYARGTEKKGSNVYQANKNRSLLWRSTQHDPKLMTLLMNFIHAYIFDWTAVANELISRQLVKATSADRLATKLATTPLGSDFFTPEIMEVMSNCKKIKNIRLNENGDFIGQWLVDAWDEQAEILEPYGVRVSAYTCRHLNYDGIKKIILNTSFKTSANVARHFIAVPAAIYDALDETYGEDGNTLYYNGDPISPNIQPLYSIEKTPEGYNIGQPTGEYYYKCPCDRVDPGFVGNKKSAPKINCYQCSLCYEPKSTNKPLYVFVKAHGSAANKLTRNSINEIGISQNFINNLQEMNPKFANSWRKEGKITQMREAVEPMEQQQPTSSYSVASRLGINQVAKNAIASTYQHFALNPNKKF